MIKLLNPQWCTYIFKISPGLSTWYFCFKQLQIVCGVHFFQSGYNNFEWVCHKCCTKNAKWRQQNHSSGAFGNAHFRKVRFNLYNQTIKNRRNKFWVRTNDIIIITFKSIDQQQQQPCCKYPKSGWLLSSFVSMFTFSVYVCFMYLSQTIKNSTVKFAR